MSVARTFVIAAAMIAAAAPSAFAQRWGRGRTPNSGACFYRDADFRGDYFCVDAGRSVSDLPRGMNDAISSVRIFGRAEVFLYRDRRFTGRSTSFDRDVRNLRRENWNDTVSSVEVRAIRGGFGGRDRDRDRNEMTLARAQDIVRRAYLSVLRREPDPGSRGYVERVMRDHWTQSDVERELRKSDEYRRRR
jgi:hypothetical protein